MNSDPYLTPQSSPPYSTPQSPPITAQVADAADTDALPDEPDKIENEIGAQAIASVVVAAFGLVFSLCLLGLILGPFAVYRGNRALRLIRTHDVGQRYQGLATTGQVAGVVVIVLNLVVIPLAVVVVRFLESVQEF